MAADKRDRFDKDAAFRSILGEEALRQLAPIMPQNLPPLKDEEKEVKAKLVQKSYYITEAQYYAIKFIAATSDKPEEKDLSTIVRTAIDHYLFKDKE